MIITFGLFCVPTALICLFVLYVILFHQNVLIVIDREKEQSLQSAWIKKTIAYSHVISYKFMVFQISHDTDQPFSYLRHVYLLSAF